jgi:hypothetical protein
MVLLGDQLKTKNDSRYCRGARNHADDVAASEESKTEREQGDDALLFQLGMVERSIYRANFNTNSTRHVHMTGNDARAVRASVDAVRHRTREIQNASFLPERSHGIDRLEAFIRGQRERGLRADDEHAQQEVDHQTPIIESNPQDANNVTDDQGRSRLQSARWVSVHAALQRAMEIIQQVRP